MEKQWKQSDFIFGGSKITADGDFSHGIKRCLLLGKKVITNLDSILKSRDITLLIKVHLVKAMAFPVVMYGCESWTVRKAERWRINGFEMWCWRRLSFESPLDFKEIQPVHSEGDQPWDFFGRNDAKTETPILWPCKELIHWKRLWCWEGLGEGGKRTTEDEMAGWHHWLNGHEFWWTLGVGDGQRGLVCCDSWGHK